MDINLSLDNLISEEDELILNAVLSCRDDDTLKQALAQIATAAMAEYLEMLLGKQVPTRANEMRERRLFHLLKHYFVGRIPTEAEISSIFQLTETDSRSLLRNTKTKFRYDLETELTNTIRATLNGARTRDGNHLVVIRSDTILEELKHTVSDRGPELPQITKVQNSAGVYTIAKETFDLLRQRYGANADIAATAE